MLIPVNWHPSRKQLRNFGLISVVAFAALGASIFFRHRLLGHPLSIETSSTVAYALWAAAALSAVVSLTSPKVMLPFYVALTFITLPIGFVVSNVMMMVLYYTVVTPIGLVLRAIGFDPMERTFNKGATTYWAKHKSHGDVKRYLQQY